MLLRVATEDDVLDLANMTLATANHLRHVDQSPYSEGLIRTLGSAQTWVSKFIDTDLALALLVENANGAVEACLLAEIASTSMPSSGFGKVGHIQLCWVNENSRQQQYAQQLTAEAEQWFSLKQIEHVELSYMADNDIAALAWLKLGYRPFRVFAHKILHV